MDRTTERLIDRLAVSPDECATLLGVSKPTVYTLVHRADFPSFKLGARTLIPMDGLRSWISRQTESEAGKA